ncbi:MFS transporter [Dyella sp. RRB7]|uniref:MFS transporter n=1 Tax=Dyella sp. RRB7 TaxID=2919502 RepID=UPI001FA9BEB0|nr:MFS transporter [Dyella sp. RRB7]
MTDAYPEPLALDPEYSRLSPIRPLSKIAYSAGAWVDGIASNAVHTFGLFYITTVLGVPGALAGFALSAGLFIDAVFDPLIGSISDSWTSGLGRRLPFMLLGLPLAVIAFQLFFSASAAPTGRQAFWNILALSIMLRSSVSLFNLPFLAFGAELTDDYSERSSIAAWRWGAGMFGGIIVVAVGFGVFFKDTDSLLHASAYAHFATCCGAIATVGALASLWATFRLRHRAHATSVPSRGILRTLLKGTAEIIRNRSFRVLFLSTMLFFVAEGATLSLGLHVNTYFWKLSARDIKFVTGAFFLGLVIGAPIIGTIARRLEKKSLVLASIGILTLAQAAPGGLRLAGLFPLQGQVLAATLVCDNFLIGLALSTAAIAANSMLADAADEHEYLFGERREGLYFAGWAFAVKSASGGGALLAGLALALSGFAVKDPLARDVTPLAVTPHTANILAFFHGPAAALLSAAGLLVLAPYKLDRARHALILATLRARRVGVAEMRAN